MLFKVRTGETRGWGSALLCRAVIGIFLIPSVGGNKCAPWAVTDPDTFTTHGRLWPIFAGERGEYDLAAYSVFGAETHLIAMGLTANEGYLLSEQVWDNQPPSGQPGFAPGTGTTSATPLAWTHAQFIRLAFDIAAGRLLEQPSIVAQRYLNRQY